MAELEAQLRGECVAARVHVCVRVGWMRSKGKGAREIVRVCRMSYVRKTAALPSRPRPTHARLPPALPVRACLLRPPRRRLLHRMCVLASSLHRVPCRMRCICIRDTHPPAATHAQPSYRVLRRCRRLAVTCPPACWPGGAVLLRLLLLQLPLVAPRDPPRPQSSAMHHCCRALMEARQQSSQGRGRAPTIPPCMPCPRSHILRRARHPCAQPPLCRRDAPSPCAPLLPPPLLLPPLQHWARTPRRAAATG